MISKCLEVMPMCIMVFEGETSSLGNDSKVFGGDFTAF